MIMAATNRPHVLDPALVRPGRFDRQITLDLPQSQAWHQMLRVHTQKVPLADDVYLERVAARTVGFSGADLKNLVNEATLLAGREHKRQYLLDRIAVRLGGRAAEKLTFRDVTSGAAQDLKQATQLTRRTKSSPLSRQGAPKGTKGRGRRRVERFTIDCRPSTGWYAPGASDRRPATPATPAAWRARDAPSGRKKGLSRQPGGSLPLGAGCR